MPFPGAESALTGVPGEGVACSSPGPACGPNAGNEQPGAANRLPNCGAHITEGVFAEKGTKKYTIGTEVGRKYVMFEELSGCQIAMVLGKTPPLLGTGKAPVRFHRVACFGMRRHLRGSGLLPPLARFG